MRAVSPLGMTEEQHRRRHRELHDALLELIDDYRRNAPPGQGVSIRTTIQQLVDWSRQQTIEPTRPHERRGGC